MSKVTKNACEDSDTAGTEFETIRDRVRRGLEQGDNEGGAILPFPAGIGDHDPDGFESDSDFEAIWLDGHGAVEENYFVPYLTADGAFILGAQVIKLGGRARLVRHFMCYEINEGTALGSFNLLPPPHPLFRLDALADFPDDPVIIVANETLVDAAREEFGEAVTTFPSNRAIEEGIDMTPLAGRHVIIVVDEEEGFDLLLAKQVGAAAKAAGATRVHIQQTFS